MRQSSHLWTPPPNGQRSWWIAFLLTIAVALAIIGWHVYAHAVSGPGVYPYSGYGVPYRPPRAPGEPVPLDEWEPPDVVACLPQGVPSISSLTRVGKAAVQYPVEDRRQRVRTVWAYFRDVRAGRDYEFVFWDQFLVAVDDDVYGTAPKWMDPGVLKWIGPRRAVLRAKPVQSCRWHRMGEPEPT